jgi:serine/threonine-protein kinase
VIGSVIDKYEVLQKLGEGATATVYRGRHLTIGRDVAIKVLHPHLSASTRYRERFNREARAVGRLAHQNIVSILDYSGGTAEDCYIVTELVDGVTLQALLGEQGRFPSELCAILGMELCSALGFAHQQGVVHRDIKPENVMVRRDGRVKLMDFGVARVADEAQFTLAGSLLGSPAYMSPQQAQDEAVDGRSDQFSLGAMLFHAATGHIPFAGTNASVILRNIIDGNRAEALELAPDIAPALAAVIDTLLRPKPEDRYADAEAARAALARVLADVELAADHPTINLRAYLAQPAEVSVLLRAHLLEKLLSIGKRRLDQGDHLGALQFFNRLLALDEGNEEVVTLVQSLHLPARPPRRRSRFIAVGISAGTLLAAVLGWAIYPRESAEFPVPAAARSLPSPSAPTSPGPDTPSAPSAAPSRAPSPALGASTPAPARNLPRAPAPKKATTATAAGSVTAPVAAAPADARLVLDRPETPVEIYVDGTRKGAYRWEKGERWSGVEANPVVVPAGKHRVTLRNDHCCEPRVLDIEAGAGATVRLDARMKKKPVLFLVQGWMPRSCTLTLGATPYGAIGGIQGLPEIHDPPADMEIVFSCPDPIGVVRERLGSTYAGETRTIPDKKPPGVP